MSTNQACPTETAKKTALYPLHESLADKLVSFAGYLLPVQYQGIRQEHLHTREHASLFDISHMGQIRLSGADVTMHLQALLPNRMTDLQPGQQRYTVLLNDQAGIVDDVMISRYQEDLMMVVNGACRDKVLDYLQQRLPGSVEVDLMQDRSLIAVQGPSAAIVLQFLNPACNTLSFMQCGEFNLTTTDCYISRSGYTGEDGFEISMPSTAAMPLVEQLLQHPQLQAAGLGARDTLRLEAGLCLYGHELNETTTPLEAGLDWLVKQRLDDDQSYPGQAIIRQQLQQGVASRRVGLLVDGKAPVREGSRILDKQMNPVGKVTSGGYSPSLNQPISMATVTQDVCAIGTELLAEVRQRSYPVTVTSMPFVPHRYHRPTT